MKALTIWQPWASLAVTKDFAGEPWKRVETRGWATNYRGPLAIHASKKTGFGFFDDLSPVERIKFGKAGIVSEEDLLKLPHGMIIGQVNLLDSIKMEELYGTAYDTPQERSFGDWSPGRFGWLLGSPVLYSEPIPAKGRQGLWEWRCEP